MVTLGARFHYRVLIGESLRQQSGKLGRVSLNFEDGLILLLAVGATQSLSLALLLCALYHAAVGLYTGVATFVEVGSEPSSNQLWNVKNPP